MIAASRELRLLVVAALETIPGLKVRSPGAWNADPKEFPEALVRTPQDSKASTGRHPSEFTTTVAVQVRLAVHARRDAIAQDELEVLRLAVETAVIGSPLLSRTVQQFSRVTTKTDFDTEGQGAIGTAVIQFDAEVFESFDPVTLGTAGAVPLLEVATTVQHGDPSTDLTIVSTLPT